MTIFHLTDPTEQTQLSEVIDCDKVDTMEVDGGTRLT
jgi:hypothetical protein